MYIYCVTKWWWWPQNAWNDDFKLTTRNTGISYHLGDICFLCRSCLNVATYKWKFPIGKLKSSFCRDRINPKELGIRDTTDKARIVSYHDLHPKINSKEWIRTKHYDKKMISIFRLGNFHFYVATFKQDLHKKHMSPRWYDIPVLLVVNLKSYQT
jgi:hypothetical protein